MGLTIIAIAAVVMMATFAGTAIAYEERSYEQLSPNGKYIFVMLAKSPDKEGRIDTLKGKYDRSGLYKAGEPAKRFWSVNWYSPTVHVSSDGVHLVRIGRKNVVAINDKPDMAQLAVAFYNKGKLVKKYTIGDLCGDPKKLVRAPAGFQWQKRIAFDDVSGRLEIDLVTGQDKVFAVRSGKIVKADTKNTRRQ